MKVLPDDFVGGRPRNGRSAVFYDVYMGAGNFARVVAWWDGQFRIQAQVCGACTPRAELYDLRASVCEQAREIEHL